jgi:Spy/CpxP family protein refolding chaperone
MTTNEQPCIWQRRCEAILPLVNAPTMTAFGCAAKSADENHTGEAGRPVIGQ